MSKDGLDLIKVYFVLAARVLCDKAGQVSYLWPAIPVFQVVSTILNV